MVSIVPTGKRELIDFAMTTIEQCRTSRSDRAAYCRLMNAIAETGRYDGQKSLINMMNGHLEKAATHIYSPVQLKFNLDYESKYPKREMERAAVVANALTHKWERDSTDMLFGRGVYEALKYGWCGLKQWCQVEGGGTDSTEEVANKIGKKPEKVVIHQKLVMPWQFGVYNEAENNINEQFALCETIMMTMPQVWRRIYHMQGAEKLFDRIRSHAQTGATMSEMHSYFHQVLSTSQLNTGLGTSTQPIPGGIVQLGNDPNFSMMGPQVAAPVVQVHELWVQDSADYSTIMMIEPDIVIAPMPLGNSFLSKPMNLLIKDSGIQPYRTIQPNETTNWFWGRSELTDIIEPQGLLSVWCDDAKRLMGLQIDKFLGFIGESGMTDELYAQARMAGYVNQNPGSTITDLTPKFPPELLPMIEFVIQQINTLGSFPPIMQGQGEPGVRAGVHADTLLKTASPTLRDRSLLVERQVATHADLTLAIMEAKDPTTYWTDGTTPQLAEESAFRLTELPDDWRVSVDSHSSSPIFANETEQLIMAAFKMGIVDEEYVLDNIAAFPNKEAAKLAIKERKKAKAAEMQSLLKQFPDAGEKLAVKMLGGGKKG